MNVLVCGARGFVGRAACAALRERGARVIEGVSRRAGRVDDATPVPMDFALDVDPAAWTPRLRGIDAVVNTVGVLRDSARRPIEAVHDTTPGALFEACASAGVRRVVQVSALGIAASRTLYARSKRAAERRLEGLTGDGRLEGVVVRPSIVFGRGGASSGLFLLLARLPALVLLAPVRRARVQPVAVAELGQAIAALALADEVAAPRRLALVEAVGPAPVALGDFIASLRAQAGRAPACVGTLPDLLTRWSARLGDRVPVAPWCSETLALLATDNVGAPAPFAALLGRPATPFDRLLSTLEAS